MSDYTKLEVWGFAHALAINVHSAATEIHGADVVSLKSQMIRASMSIPTNLVEGCGQESAREFARSSKSPSIPRPSSSTIYASREISTRL